MKLHRLQISSSLNGYLILLAIAYFLFSCNVSDDLNSDAKILVDITVLGRNNNSVLQADINRNLNITNFNLTETLGINPNSQLMDVHNYENIIGYYFSPPFDDSYSVWEKTISTNQGVIYNEFCNETTIETPYFPQVSEDYLTVFTAELVSTGNRVLNLRIYNKALDFCSKTSIGIADEFQQLTRLIIENKILTYHFNNQGETVITKMSLETGAIEGQLTFTTSGAATVRNNTLYFYPSSGSDSQISYDLNTFQFLESSSFGTIPISNRGLFKTEWIDNSILIDRNYIQPAEFTMFPALLNQDSGDITMLADLGTTSSNLISYLNSDLAIQMSQSYTVDIDKNIIVGSYTLFNFDVTIIEYGVYFAYFSGEILGTVPIDFSAEKIIIR